MDQNQMPNENNHSHKMRNIIVPILVVVALLIVGLFLSNNFSFANTNLGASAGGAIAGKTQTPTPAPAEYYWSWGGWGSFCIGTGAYGNGFFFGEVTLNSTTFQLNCSSIAPVNFNPVTKEAKVFGSRITAKHYTFLQEFLSAKGFLENNYKTGKNDIKTKTALKDFQQSVGLPKSGVMTAATKATINKILASEISKVSVKTADPVVSNPNMDTNAVCVLALSYCLEGCISGDDDLDMCEMNCQDAYKSCEAGAPNRSGTVDEVKPI